MVLNFQTDACPVRRSPAALHPLLLVLLTSFLFVRVSPSAESPSLPACPSATGLFHKAHAWGAGVEGKDIQLGEDTCFLLEARVSIRSGRLTDCLKLTVHLMRLVTAVTRYPFCTARSGRVVNILRRDHVDWRKYLMAKTSIDVNCQEGAPNACATALIVAAIPTILERRPRAQT